MAFGDEREPAFNLIEPGCVGRGVMDMIMRPRRQPGPHLAVFVGGIIVDDEV